MVPLSKIRSCSVAKVCPTLQPRGLCHARLPCPSLSPRVCSNLRPLSWWCYPTIPPSVIPFSFCPQSFPASGSFPMSQLFESDGQSIGSSDSTPVLPVNIQGWSPLGLTGLISSPSKGLWCFVFFTSIPDVHVHLTSVQDYWKPQFWLYGPLLQADFSAL